MTMAVNREHRISVERFSKLRRSSRIERVLVLLVESGFVYCLLWVRHDLYGLRLPSTDIDPDLYCESDRRRCVSDALATQRS